MCDQNCCRLHRRALLSALGASTMTGAAVASESESTTETTRSGSYQTTVEVEPLNTNSIAETVMTTFEDLSKVEREAVTDAANGEATRFEGRPSFGPSAFFSDGERYYVVNLTQGDVVETQVPVLSATKVERQARAAVSIASADAQDQPQLTEAIGRERARELREDTAGETSNADSAEELSTDSRGLSNSSTEQDSLERRPDRGTYVLEPHEEPPTGLEPGSEPLLIADGGDVYELLLEEETRRIETTEITVDHTFHTEREFDEWFEDTHLYFDSSVEELENDGGSLLSQATNEPYAEVSPYSLELRTILEELDLSEGGTNRTSRIARLNDELVSITVTQSVGC